MVYGDRVLASEQAGSCRGVQASCLYQAYASVFELTV